MEYSNLLAILLVMLAAGWMSAIIFGLILAVARWRRIDCSAI
jgi:hypothetical protein